MLTQEVFEKFKVLSLEQQELFLKRLDERQLSPLEIPVFPIKKKELELSFAQERIWFLQQLELESDNYILNRCLRLRGPLSYKALKESLQAIVQRHEILRTGIFKVNGKPIRVIKEALEVSLEKDSLKGKSPEDIQKYLVEKSSQVFDLEQSPLFRFLLFETDQEDEHIFLMNIHHIISDGLSIDTFFKELSFFYNSIVQEQQCPLPSLHFSYSDYVFWQRKWFQEKRLETSLQFWKTTLKDPPQLTLFPPDFSNQQSHQAHQLCFEFGHCIYDQLISFCKETKVTLFHFFLTCLNVLIHRYTGHIDLILGTPSSGRLRPELFDLIGLFANTVVLRNSVHRTDSFLDCLKKVSQASVEAFDHQLVPFERIIQEIAIDRNLNYSPLFQIFFIFHKARQESLKLHQLDWKILDVMQRSPKFAMTFEIIEFESSFKLNIEYDTSLYKLSTIERLTKHFQNIISSFLRNPYLSIENFPLLSSEEESLFDKWNCTEVDFPNQTIQELISQTVIHFPQSTAIECGMDSMTYLELEQQSNCIAKFLLTRNFSLGSRIGLFMLPNISLVPCLLGILKAGCTYIPLDPSYPLKRLELMVEEAELKIMITDGKSPLSLSLEIEIIEFSKALQSYQEIKIPPIPDSGVAYVMYTSGSTGKPKGIMVEHRNVVNALLAFRDILKINSTDRWLSTTTFAFDISVLEFFLPLIVGATLRIAQRMQVLDIEELINEIDQFKPTIIQGTPSFWSLLLMKAWTPHYKFTVLCGGEQLTLSLAKRLLQLGNRVFNVYGPTETTIWSTYHEIREQEEDIFIGKPIANTQIFILDESKNRVPVNVIGEIYIAGKGVSSGYLNRPELMRERFVKLPHLHVNGVAFSTKDKAKFTENGLIQFIGRGDQQVKIRGFRVELQEIEANLQLCKHVQRAVVYAKENAIGQHDLCAIVQPSQTCEISDLVLYLKERLPTYMIPAQWKILDQIPFLPNGKIDQKALRQIDFDYNLPPDEIGNDFIDKLTAIWKKNLQKEHVRLHDHYFELGGHSLLAVQLIDEVNRAFKTTMSLKLLFKYPTIAQMAQFIEKDAQSESSSPHQNILPNVHDHYLPFPLTDVQRAYWAGRTSIFGNSQLSSHLYREIEIKDVDITKLEKALHHLIQRHAALRIVILNDAQQQVLEQVPFYKIEVQDVRHLNEQEGEKIRANTRQNMSHQLLVESEWPLFSIKVTRLQHVDCLHMSLNLLIADASSLEILLDEWEKLYRDPEFLLKPLSITFRDYVEHVNKLKESSDYQSSKEYWLGRIEKLPSNPQLPIQSPLASLTNPRVKRYTKCLEKQAWEKIKSIGKKEGLTPTVLLLTAFSIVLRQWSHDPSFSIILTLFNRLPIHPEIDSIVGDFTTVSVLEIPFKETSSFIDLAKACQTQLFEDLDHRFFNGILVTQELLKKGKISEPIPIVFTSLLGFNSLDESPFHGKDQDPTQIFSVTQTPQVILDHQVMEDKGNLYLNWDVVEEVFPEQLISIMFETYISFLSNFTGQDSRSLPLEVVQPNLIEKMKWKRNQPTKWGTDKAKLLHEGVLKQAAIRPNAIAIIQGEEQISYLRLAQESARISQALQNLQTPNQSLIGILIDKSWQQIACTIGILMTGCIYLPLDASLPLARIEEIIQESGCKTIIAANALDLSHVHQMIYGDLPTILEQNLLPFHFEMDPHALAYVIYTSGSTGPPKGVMIEHQAVMNTIHAVNQRLNITEQDTIYGISSLSFDLSVYDIFGILSLGGKLVLPEAEAIRDPEKWLEAIQRHHISIWNSVPYFVSMLMEYIKDHEDRIHHFRNLRTIMMSGDWIPIHLPPAIYSIHPSIYLLSLGGATEASIWSIWYEIPKHAHFSNSIPYGESMDNQQVFILDSQLEERTVYAEGEIYIGGAGVAKGYWKNQERTHLQFLSHPKFGRLFRTFDKGRYLLNGNIEFLGRTDRQVKLRGFRIELAEIECKLNQCAFIQQSTVLLNHQDIHAFVILKKEITHQEKPSFLSVKADQSYLRKDLEEAKHERTPLIANPHLHKIISLRQSFRSFTHHLITLTDFSILLSCLKHLQLDHYPFIKAFYGSASGLYPVQLYCHIKPNRIDGLSAGNYYYHPLQNQLIKVNDEEIPHSCFAPNNQHMVNEAAFYMFLVANLSVIEPIYQAKSKQYCDIEAGLMTQLLEMQSVETSIGLCQVGNTHFEVIANCFDLPSSSLYLHGLVGGYCSQEMKNDVSSFKHQIVLPSYETLILDDLKQKLPHYMIPSSVTILSAFPLTNNGKIDQKKLLQFVQNRMKQQAPIKMDDKSVYELLVTIWQDILNISYLPNHQTSFFDLGGDSIKLIQLHKALDANFDIKISMGDLFRFSTIEEQTHYLTQKANQQTPFEQSKQRAQLRDQSRRRKKTL